MRRADLARFLWSYRRRCRAWTVKRYLHLQFAADDWTSICDHRRLGRYWKVTEQLRAIDAEEMERVRRDNGNEHAIQGASCETR